MHSFGWKSFHRHSQIYRNRDRQADKKTEVKCNEISEVLKNEEINVLGLQMPRMFRLKPFQPKSQTKNILKTISALISMMTDQVDTKIGSPTSEIGKIWLINSRDRLC